MNVESTYKKDFGKKGEDTASSFLIKNGFDIIKKNYRFQRLGEIDLIARKDNLIIFVEVKNRKTPYYGGAPYSINKRKKETIKKIAGQFLTANPSLYTKDFIYRFDLISVNNGRVEWIEDIIR